VTSQATDLTLREGGGAEIGAVLERLTERLDRLERALTPVLGEAPQLLATATDTFDEAVQNARLRGIDLEERSANLLQLAERLTHPQTVGAISTLLERAAELEALLTLAADAPNLVATLVDTVDGYMERARDEGIDIEQVLGTLALLGGGLSRATEAALTEGRAAQGAPSVLGLGRLLGDPDVRRSLGFFLNLAKHFGRTLNASQGGQDGSR
jgi:uncharacterized protein YjgD (DUF1641 family)